MRRPALLILMTALLTACATGATAYLEKAVDHATQEDVTRHLGVPKETAIQPEGTSTWTYRYQGYDGFNQESWCREHILTFDAQRILRKWVREDC